MEITKEEAIENLEDGMEIKVSVGGSTFTIGDMHGYVGSPENKEGFISEYLGNVWYSDAEGIIDETVDGIADGNKDLMATATYWID